jgi:hypothetical protein
MRYWPNPAHKAETTEAGPPLWTPDKDLCPTGMTVAERRDDGVVTAAEYRRLSRELPGC